MKAKNDGKALQRLIRAIESALAAGNETVKVEMGKRLPDKVTGKLREHDVVLTITNNHHETIIALECRDRSRRVGVDAVEAFHNKCQDTGINSGIIVSASGFWKSAVEKATHYNIGCLSLTEAEGFDWCIATGLTNYSRKLIHTHLGVIFPGPSAVDNDNVRTADGTPLNHQIVTRWAANALNQYHPVPMEEPGEHHVRIRERNPNIYGTQDDGKRVQAIEAQFIMTYTVTVAMTPFSFRTYMDVAKSKQVTQAAVCTLAISPDQVADVVMSTNEVGEITIALVGHGIRPVLEAPAK